MALTALFHPYALVLWLYISLFSQIITIATYCDLQQPILVKKVTAQVTHMHTAQSTQYWSCIPYLTAMYMQYIKYLQKYHQVDIARWYLQCDLRIQQLTLHAYIQKATMWSYYMQLLSSKPEWTEFEVWVHCHYRKKESSHHNRNCIG